MKGQSFLILMCCVFIATSAYKSVKLMELESEVEELKATKDTIYIPTPCRTDTVPMRSGLTITM